jgi:hypothetical protein
MDQFAALAIAFALAWASGIRLYAVLFLIGIAGYVQWFGWQPPETLKLLSHPLVLGATGLLLTLEFFADKIPAVDSIWDAIHTFIRIPAGALLAAGAIGTQDGEAWTLAVALLGGSITAGTHFLKSGGRATINASPEPFTNWAASFTEDVSVLAGLWLAFTHPVVFLLLLLLFVLVAAWLLPKVWRMAVGLVRKLFSAVKPQST